MINLKTKKYKNTYFYLKQKVVIPNNTINTQDRHKNISHLQTDNNTSTCIYKLITSA